MRGLRPPRPTCLPAVPSEASPATPTQLAATILAAGMGLRLGSRPKAALEIDGVSLLQRHSQALACVGATPVRVVIGPYADTLLPLARQAHVQPLVHTLATPSLIDSQRLAVRAHLADPQLAACDLMLLVADLPELNASHLAPLMQAWHQRPDGVHALVPTVEGRRGHPVILSLHALRAISAQADHLGVRDWMTHHRQAVQVYSTPHRAHVTDLDTQEDLVMLQTRLAPQHVAWPVGLAGAGASHPGTP